jgi:hypothetical protein
MRLANEVESNSPAASKSVRGKESIPEAKQLLSASGLRVVSIWAYFCLIFSAVVALRFVSFNTLCCRCKAEKHLRRDRHPINLRPVCTFDKSTVCVKTLVKKLTIFPEDQSI